MCVGLLGMCLQIGPDFEFVWGCMGLWELGLIDEDEGPVFLDNEPGIVHFSQSLNRKECCRVEFD